MEALEWGGFCVVEKVCFILHIMYATSYALQRNLLSRAYNENKESKETCKILNEFIAMINCYNI